MFIRTKKINNKLYGYLVKNTWTPKGSRQKVVGYLGKVHQPQQEKDHEFSTEHEDPKTIAKQLILWELEKHGFSPYPDNKDQLINNFVIYNKKNHSLKERKKDVLLKINEGHLCNHSLKALFKELGKGPLEEEQDPRERATELAEAFTNAGIQIPQEIFIQIFQEITKK